MATSSLVRRRDIGDFEGGQRTLAPVSGKLHRARHALLTTSSLMCVRTDERVLALTYDDGPLATSTPAVLDALAAAGARATFFVLVERAEAEPALLARILREGHEVGLHGEDHARLSPLPLPEAVRRIRRGRARLEALTGRPVRLYRPTYGAQRAAQVLATRALGLEIVIWTCWARDWEPATAEQVTDRAMAAVHPGAIVLLHDAGSDDLEFQRGVADPAAVTTGLLSRLAAEGYRTATVGELRAEHMGVRSLWFETATAARRAVAETRGPV